MRVWNESGQLRLDTNDRTLRLTSMIKVGYRRVPQGSVINQFIPIPGFNPAIDGVFLNPGEPAALVYEAQYNSGYRFMPDISPVAGGVNIIWRGFGPKGSASAGYMDCYLMVLRAF